MSAGSFMTATPLAVVDDRLGRLAVVLDVTAVELLDARSCASDLPRQDDLRAERAGVHDPVDRRVTGLPEVPATLERVGQSVRDDSCVEVGFVDLLHVDLRSSRLNFSSRAVVTFRMFAAFADDHPGLLGSRDDLGSHRRLGDVHTTVARAAELFLEELIYLGPLQAVFDELVFVSHWLSSSSSSTSSTTISHVDLWRIPGRGTPHRAGLARTRRPCGRRRGDDLHRLRRRSPDDPHLLRRSRADR